MRVFVMRALSASALLATTSVQAHPITAAPVALPAAHTICFEAPDSVAVLGNFFTGPALHFSSRPSYSGFRSAPSRSYSAPATRSYSAPRTYSFRPSSPSISRPAATLTPRTYTYNISGVPRTKAYAPAPTSSPAEVHYYHDGGSKGGGLSATDLLLMNAVMNSNRQSQGINTVGSTSRYASDDDNYLAAQARKEDEGLSGWQICGIVLVVSCIVYRGYRYVTAD